MPLDSFNFIHAKYSLGVRSDLKENFISVMPGRIAWHVPDICARNFALSVGIVLIMGSTLQARIYTARSAAIRCITSDIAEFAVFFALWADIRWSGRGDGVTTFLALPKCQAAARTNIPDEFSCGRVTTQGTFHFFILLLHLSASSVD
jgi:hypothetical protein